MRKVFFGQKRRSDPTLVGTPCPLVTRSSTRLILFKHGPIAIKAREDTQYFRPVSAVSFPHIASVDTKRTFLCRAPLNGFEASIAHC